MKHDFPLHNPANKLQIAIADTIKKYYPVGIDSYSDDYDQHPARIAALKIINENFMWSMAGTLPGQIARAFSLFFEELKQYSGNETVEHSSMIGPGFSGSIILEKYQDATLERVKRITFAVSAFGPFFSVCGIDETIIKLDDMPYPAINVVTKSPYKEFEHSFKYAEHCIKKYFPDYRFVPFEICMMILKGKEVDIPFSSGKDDTIYAALFDTSFKDYGHMYPRGNWYTGGEESL